MVCAADVREGWCCQESSPACNSQFAVGGVDSDQACCASTTECCTQLPLNLRLMDDDDTVELHNGMSVGPNGVVFDGVDDYATIAHVDYASTLSSALDSG